MPLYTLTFQPGPAAHTPVHEFADDDAAECEAKLVARDMAKNRGPMSAGERITVRNSSGRLVCEAYLIDAAMKN